MWVMCSLSFDDLNPNDQLTILRGQLKQFVELQERITAPPIALDILHSIMVVISLQVAMLIPLQALVGYIIKPLSISINIYLLRNYQSGLIVLIYQEPNIICIWYLVNYTCIIYLAQQRLIPNSCFQSKASPPGPVHSHSFRSGVGKE